MWTFVYNTIYNYYYIVMSYDSLLNINNLYAGFMSTVPNASLYTDQYGQINGINAPNSNSVIVVPNATNTSGPSVIQYDSTAVSDSLAQRTSTGALSCTYLDAYNNDSQITMSEVDNSIIIRGTQIDLVGPVKITSTLITDSSNNGFLLNSTGAGLVDVFYCTQMADTYYSGVVYKYVDTSTVYFARSKTLPGSTYPVDSYMNVQAGNITANGYITAGSNKVTTTYVPINPEDLTNKLYVDSSVSPISGLYLRLDCSNGPLNGMLGTQTLQPSTTAKYTIGDPTHLYNEIYGSTCYTDVLDSITGSISLNDLAYTRDLKPSTSASYLLGDPTHIYKSAHCTTVNCDNITAITSNINLNNTLVSKAIQPDASMTYDVGSGSLYYSNMYCPTYRAPVGSNLDLYSGTTAINVHNSQVTNLASASGVSTNAVNYSDMTTYVSGAYLPLSGGTMTGDIKVSGVLSLGSASHAWTNLYVNNINTNSTALNLTSTVSINEYTGTVQQLTSAQSQTRISQIDPTVDNTQYTFINQQIAWRGAVWLANYKDIFVCKYDTATSTYTRYRDIYEYGNFRSRDDYINNTRMQTYVTYPQTDNNTQFGSATNRWSILYATGLDSRNSNMMIQVTGTSYLQFNIASNDIRFTNSNLSQIASIKGNGATDIITKSAITPDVTNSYSLGQYGAGYTLLYTRGLASDNSGPITLNNSMNPPSKVSVNLGVYSTLEYTGIYTANLGCSSNLAIQGGVKCTVTAPNIQLSGVVYCGDSYVLNTTNYPLQISTSVLSTPRWLTYTYGATPTVGSNTSFCTYNVITGQHHKNPDNYGFHFWQNNNERVASLISQGSSMTTASLVLLSGAYTTADPRVNGVWFIPADTTYLNASMELRASGSSSFVDFATNSSTADYNARIICTNSDLSVISLGNNTTTGLNCYTTATTTSTITSPLIYLTGDVIKSKAPICMYVVADGYGFAYTVGTNYILPLTLRTANSVFYDTTGVNYVKILKQGYYKVSISFSVLSSVNQNFTVGLVSSPGFAYVTEALTRTWAQGITLYNAAAVFYRQCAVNDQLYLQCSGTNTANFTIYNCVLCYEFLGVN